MMRSGITLLILLAILSFGTQTLKLEHDYRYDDWLSPYYKFPDKIVITAKPGFPDPKKFAGVYEKGPVIVNHGPVWRFKNPDFPKILVVNPKGKWTLIGASYLPQILTNIAQTEDGLKPVAGAHISTNANFNPLETTWKYFTVSGAN